MLLYHRLHSATYHRERIDLLYNRNLTVVILKPASTVMSALLIIKTCHIVTLNTASSQMRPTLCQVESAGGNFKIKFQNKGPEA